MVDKLDPHDPPCLSQATRHDQIFAARRRVATAYQAEGARLQIEVLDLGEKDPGINYE